MNRLARHGGRPWIALAALASWAAAAPSGAAAQPEPSFRAACSGLREAADALGPGDEESLVTIQVEGRLTGVQSDGALVYMTLCAPPDPRVLCVTYSADERKAGDAAVLAGTYSRRGPDHILLDPCLHFTPDPAGR